jgi:hypothetical protein
MERMYLRWGTKTTTRTRPPKLGTLTPKPCLQGLKSAKEIWEVLKTAHEGDELTKITKRETIEGELGRFFLNKGEEPQAMYNRLKTMVNQVSNLRSTKWDDHEMVKVILRSLVFRNPTQVKLIRGDPRYKLMSPEEVIGKFVSFKLMIKDSKHIVNLEQGATSTPEVQPVAFKATEEKEESTSSRFQIDASKLDNEEMALIIKSFSQILKQRRGKNYKSHSKMVVGAKAKTPPFARGLRRTRCTNGDKTTGRLTLRLICHRTKTCDEVVSSCDLAQNGGPCVIRPIVTGPAWPLRVMGLICKGLPVITVCNPALWEYSGDNLGV